MSSKMSSIILVNGRKKWKRYRRITTVLYDAAIEKFNLALETLKDDEAKLRGMAIDVELSRFQVHLY